MKAGEVLMFSSGSYSDYGVGGIYRVLKDFSMRDEIAKGMASYVPPAEYADWMRFGESDLAENLMRDGLVENISVREVHFWSNYGDRKLMFDVDGKDEE